METFLRVAELLTMKWSLDSQVEKTARAWRKLRNESYLGNAPTGLQAQAGPSRPRPAWVAQAYTGPARMGTGPNALFRHGPEGPLAGSRWIGLDYVLVGTAWREPYKLGSVRPGQPGPDPALWKPARRL